jgi:hypothetical protein
MGTVAGVQGELERVPGTDAARREALTQRQSLPRKVQELSMPEP